jgi:hypothetical protein
VIRTVLSVVTLCSQHLVIAVARRESGSWTESLVQAVQSEPLVARPRGISAGSAPGAPGRASHNPPVVGSSPTRPTSGFDTRGRRAVDRIVYRCRRGDIRTVGPHLVT